MSNNLNLYTWLAPGQIHKLITCDMPFISSFISIITTMTSYFGRYWILETINI